MPSPVRLSRTRSGALLLGCCLLLPATTGCNKRGIAAPTGGGTLSPSKVVLRATSS